MARCVVGAGRAGDARPHRRGLRRAGTRDGLPPARGRLRARLHLCFVLPLIHFISDLLTYSVPLFLKRQCDRTLGGLQDLGEHSPGR
jgi:hypothetical protein